MTYDVLVVGAGPAGLFAAVSAARSGARTLLCERMRTPARKLLVSGSGQCNFTHAGSIPDFLGRYGPAGKFLRPALYGFSNDLFVDFLARRGVESETTEAGKVFPRSRRARDVLDALLEEARGLGVELRTDARVRSAGTEGESFAVELFGADGAAGDSLRASALVVAAGGKSYPKTGSSGDGYGLARSFGHGLAEPRPALTPVEAAMAGPAPFRPFVSCAGASIPVSRVRIFRSGRKVAEGRGDVLFTHRGLSGPGILDLSRWMRPADELRVSLTSAETGIDETESRLLGEFDAHGARSVVRVLQAFGMTESVARAALAALGVGGDAKAATLPRAARRALVSALSDGGDAGWPFVVEALGGWEEAMATAGGVPLDEVDPRTMGSRFVPGLFFAGEVLDYDGDTGGFNIQAAASTGVLAGSCAAGSAGLASDK